MSVLDDYMNRRKKEEDNDEDFLTSYINAARENARTTPITKYNNSQSDLDYIDNYIKQVKKNQEYKNSLSETDRDAYNRVQMSNGVYSSPYLKSGSEGKEKLKYNNPEWNALSESERRHWLDVAEGNLKEEYNKSEWDKLNAEQKQYWIDKAEGKTKSKYQSEAYRKMSAAEQQKWIAYAKQHMNGTSDTKSSSPDDWKVQYAAKILNDNSNISSVYDLGAKSDSLPSTYDLASEQKWMWNALPKSMRDNLVNGSHKDETTAYLTEHYSPEEVEMFRKYAAAIKNSEIKQENERKEESRIMNSPLYATFVAPAKQMASDILISPLAAIDTMSNIKQNTGVYGVVDPYGTAIQRQAALGQYINQSINEGLSERQLAAFAYNTSVSTAESAIRLAIARGIGAGLSSVAPSISAEAATGVAMNALMAPSVVNQTATELIEKGVPAQQALNAAVMHGVFECLFETVSFDKLDFFDAKPIVADTKTFLKNLAKAGFVEGSEEVATDIANELYDYLTMYDYSDFKAFKDTWDASRGTESTDKEAWNEYKKEFALKLAQSFAGGAVSGLSMGAVTNAQGIANARALNAKGETVTDADADRMRPIVDSVAAINPNVRNLMENAMGNETTVRGAMADVIEQMEKTYIKSIEKATTEKQLNTVMENMNTNLNGLISENAFNAYNAKMTELGKEGADYQTFLTNRDKGNQTTFSDLAYGTGDNYISRQYTEAKNEMENAMRNTTNGMNMEERIASVERAAELMSKSQELAEDIVAKYGEQGKTLDSPELRKYVGILGEESAARALTLGKLARESNTENVNLKGGKVYELKDTAEIERMLGKGASAHLKPAEYNEVKNNPLFRVVSVMTGANVAFYASDQHLSIKNGAYDPKTNTFYFDANAGTSGTHAALGEVISHELTHWIRANNEAGYDRLYMFIRNDMGADAFDSLVKEHMDRLDLDSNVAAEEVVAEACQRMLSSSETFMRYAAADTEGAKSLLSRLKNFIKKLRNAFRGSLNNEATRLIEDYEGLAAEWEKALNEAIATANTEALKQDAMIHGFDFESADDAVYRNSWRYNLTDEQIDKYSKLMSDQLGCTVKEAENYFKAADSLSSFVLDPLYNKYLDYDPDGRYTAIKKNADYPQGTVDFTNNCRKRTIFTNVFDRLQKAMPNRIFNAVTLADLRETLKKFGYKVACALCFVEDRRQRMGEIGDLYVKALTNSHKNFNNVLMYTNSKKESYPLLMTQTLKDRYGDRVPFQPGEQIVITDDYVPTQYDIVTYDGFAKLTEEHPTVALGFEAYNNRRGMSSARLIEGRGEYKREILNYTTDQVKRINDLGGLRIFSFSDFEVVHLLDLCQIITDCATVGLKIQTYTKVPSFAKLIRNTNIKCNRSLIPKGKGWDVDAKGNKYLVYDTTEGIDIDDPDFFDSTDSENIGSILVGINKEQIRLAMVDDFVDYIIPFHTNQAKKVLIKKGISLWDNYKKFQTDKTASGSPTMVNIYTEVLDKYNPQNKYQFVDAFLRECQSRNITPRFEEFIDKENGKYKTVTVDGQTYMYTPGYEKFLVDFKLFDKHGNILPQKAVFPTIDMEFAENLMKSEAATAKEQDKVDDAVVNELIEKYKDKNAKFSSRDTEYLNAIGRGDQDAAQRYVDEAAREAGYTSEKLYHGTSAFGFTEIDKKELKDHISFFATDSESVASTYSGTKNARAIADNDSNLGIYQFYANTDGMLELDAKGADSGHIELGKITKQFNDYYNPNRWNAYATARQIAKFAKANGYTGVIIRNLIDTATPETRDNSHLSSVYAFFNAKSQVKSADTVTYTDDGEIIPPSERFNKEEKDIRYSMRDSEGRELSHGQQEYFADSKVRDADGNLMVVYHGSPAKDITVFDKNRAGAHTSAFNDKAIWFTDDEKFADDFSYEFLPGNSAFTYRRGEKGKVYGGYLNLTNPFDITNPTAEMMDYINEKVGEERAKKLLEIGNHQLIKFDLDLSEIADMGYDGIIARLDTYDRGGGIEYGAFESNQFKSIDNESPTENDDIRYSLRSVPSVEPTTDEWQSGHSEAWFRENGYPIREDVSQEWLQKRIEKGWWEGEKEYSQKGFDKTSKKEGTQISSTVSTYEKLYDMLERQYPNGEWKNLRILDASSGLGLGTKRGLERGFNVTDIEPYVHPDSDYFPDYMDYSSLQDKVRSGEVEPFDFIISNAVLNVIPQDTRDAMVDWFDSVLAPGGRIFVSTLGAKYTNDKTDNDGTKVTQRGKNGGGSEIYVKGSNSVQKGFSRGELQAYLRDALGGNYTFENAPSGIGRESATIATKGDTRYSVRDGVANYTEERVDRLLRQYGAKNTPNYAQAYAAYISPDDFLMLTTNNVENIERESRELNEQELRDNPQEIFLKIEEKNGKMVVYGHEGRHRMVALRNQGASEVAISVIDLATKYTKEITDSMTLSHQIFNEQNEEDFEADIERKAEITDLIPISYENEDILKRRFTGEHQVKFSYRDLANSESEILINALKNDAALVDELGAKQSIEAYAREYNRLKEMENQQIEITKQLRKKDTSPSEREVLLKKMVRLDRAILNKTTELTETRNQRVIRDLLISEWDKRDTLVAAGRAEERYLTRKALEEKYGKELSALKEKTRQQKQEIRDRHTINERKANIIKKTKQLMDMCLHPTEKKKVPTVLINPVVELLDAIDYWTPAEGRRVTKKSESLRERFVNFREAINEYQEQINEGTEQIEYMFDPEFLETVDELAKSVKGINNVNDMNAEEITALDQTLTQLYHLISRGNKMITASHYQTVDEYKDKTRQAMEKRKTLSEKTSAKGNWLTRLNAGMADSYAFGEYAGEGTREIIDMLSKAFEDKEFHVKEAIEFTQEVLKPYKNELKKWSQDEHEFTLSTTDKDGNPNKVKLTVGQMMELYLLNKREQARGHIYGGGIRVENRKGKFTESVKIAEQDVAEIMEYLKSVPGAMEVADKLQQYGATTITGWGNQASNLMYGISKFTDENYWQIRSDSSALKDNENTEKALNASMYRLQNMGRTKAVKKGANNAIYIGDVFDTWSKTIDEMTSYASILPATTDAMRWWNSRVELDGENTVRVKKLLESKLGTDMTRVFTDTIKALNGGIMGTDSLESLVKKLTGKAKAAAVAGNLRVVLQQPTAYTRAAAVIDKKYLLKALMTKPNAKEAQEHSAIAWHKAQGFYSNGLAPSLRKMVIGDASIGENLTEKALWLAGKADDLTWGYLWNASKLKVEAENKALKVGSDAYWNEVNKVFSNIINQTQVVDTPLTKSTWMRGNGLGVYFTAFMAEPTKTYSMVMERLDRVLQNPTSKDAWRAFAGVGAVFAVNAMVNAMAQALADAARDDDKEKDYWEKYIEKYQEDVKDNINPLTYIPVVKDIWSLSQGYSNSNLSMQAAQNTVYAVNELKKIANGTSKKTLFGQAETVAKAISGWTGIPVGNVMRTLNSIGNVAGVDIFRRKKYTNSELGRNVVLSMNEGDTSAADKYMAELLENCKGDTNKANNYVITYLADHDNEIDAWAERYMEDATTINDAIDAMSDKYSAEIVTKAIRKSVNNDADEDDKIKTSTLAESQYTSDDINRMLESGKITEAQDIIDEVNAKYKEMGSKTTAKNAVTAYWKPKYLAASGAERDKILKMLYKLKNNGQQMYSSKDIAKWS